jgi:hypothetical protein
MSMATESRLCALERRVAELEKRPRAAGQAGQQALEAAPASGGASAPAKAGKKTISKPKAAKRGGGR